MVVHIVAKGFYKSAIYFGLSLAILCSFSPRLRRIVLVYFRFRPLYRHLYDDKKRALSLKLTKFLNINNVPLPEEYDISAKRRDQKKMWLERMRIASQLAANLNGLYSRVTEVLLEIVAEPLMTNDLKSLRTIIGLKSHSPMGNLEAIFWKELRGPTHKIFNVEGGMKLIHGNSYIRCFAAETPDGIPVLIKVLTNDASSLMHTVKVKDSILQVDLEICSSLLHLLLSNVFSQDIVVRLVKGMVRISLKEIDFENHSVIRSELEGRRVGSKMTLKLPRIIHYLCTDKIQVVESIKARFGVTKPDLQTLIHLCGSLLFSAGLCITDPSTVHLKSGNSFSGLGTSTTASLTVLVSDISAISKILGKTVHDFARLLLMRYDEFPKMNRVGESRTGTGVLVGGTGFMAAQLRVSGFRTYRDRDVDLVSYYDLFFPICPRPTMTSSMLEGSSSEPLPPFSGMGSALKSSGSSWFLPLSTSVSNSSISSYDTIPSRASSPVSISQPVPPNNSLLNTGVPTSPVKSMDSSSITSNSYKLQDKLIRFPDDDGWLLIIRMRSLLMSMIITADVPLSIDDIWIPLALQLINAKQH